MRDCKPRRRREPRVPVREEASQKVKAHAQHSTEAAPSRCAREVAASGVQDEVVSSRVARSMAMLGYWRVTWVFTANERMSWVSARRWSILVSVGGEAVAPAQVALCADEKEFTGNSHVLGALAPTLSGWASILRRDDDEVAGANPARPPNESVVPSLPSAVGALGARALDGVLVLEIEAQILRSALPGCSVSAGADVTRWSPRRTAWLWWAEFSTLALLAGPSPMILLVMGGAWRQSSCDGSKTMFFSSERSSRCPRGAVRGS